MIKAIKKTGILLSVVLLLIVGTSMESLAKVSDVNLNKAVEDTAKFMHQKVASPQVGSVGGEWALIGLARSEYNIPDSYYENYYTVVEKHVESKSGNLHDVKYTEYSRVIVALTAMGKDPRDVAGYNLLTPLGDYDKTIFQGLNGPIWALIALDSGNYDMPINPEARTQATRQMYIDRILACQLADGGWSLMGGTPYAKDNETSDPDITGMVLQALAKYQDMPQVKKATEESLTTLSKLQGEDGGFNSWGLKNLESNVQVIVALGELGLSLEDERFVKNGHTLLDNLYTFYKAGNGFVHSLETTGSDQMASEQGFYGIVAAKRLREGKDSLYRIGHLNQVKDQESKDQSALGLPDKHKDINYKPVIKPDISFEDISAQDTKQYKSAIESLASRGILGGKTESAFDPNGKVTRAEFAAILVRALGVDIKESKNQIFTDVKPAHWFYDQVITANAYGIVSGVSKDSFNPAGTITKQEVAAMLANAGQLAGMKLETNTMAVRDVLSQFEDYVSVKEWAMSSMAFAYSEGIFDDGAMTINPGQIVTRGQIAQMVFNLLEQANLL